MQYKLFTITFLIFIHTIVAQNDSTKIKRVPIDTIKPQLNMDAVYNRPFLQYGKTPVALGGYIEANTQYAVTDGVTDGFSFVPS